MSVMDTLKTVAGLAQRVGDIELHQQIIGLQTEVYGLLEENHQLRMEMKENKDKQEIEKQLIFEDNFYYLSPNPGVYESGPYCSGCWDKENKLVRLHTYETFSDVFLADCPVCKLSLDIEEAQII
ncbi:hypothetical protein [Halobacillus salinus]|uniref:Uncharacterized protein n=1 Tax=Halobacillus salinus TaxID=192814 RepID=A0A4Z0H2T3_9BACI|nr:hypothetical protein [Halobacillus salinus]TGB04682.1 hypothetical protein E4663_06740 [Halobacillus salinus]